MIPDDSKYFSLSGYCPVGRPSTWHVTDWDQRRIISVTMDGEQDDESLAIKHLSRIDSSQLPRGIYRVHVSDTGEIISRFSDPKNDATCCVHYPFLGDLTVPEGIQTVRRDELEELERLGPDVDLVADDANPLAQVVFKYYWLWQYAHSSWKEMNLWMRLPRRHPNIVPFDRVVVDELEGRAVGFTNAYVPGGNLKENPSRVFKLEWLRQLIKAVDELNLQYGIAHQDIAPRNLAVDESTDSVMLFDFNFAARINYSPLENGNDYSLREKPHEEQNLDDIALGWGKHPEVKLDHPVASYQLILQGIDWPRRPDPPQKTVTHRDIQGKPVEVSWELWDEKRQDVLARGGKVLNWERPPQKVLDGGVRVLSNGEVIKC
ncbi:hypothetical protein B0T21DRAFT_443486 [Apiosordaria backusii]|uniref:Protein kinase domain-containing protein n=1 Tax=Apiosordaria backusii TaxID=314023 RepID=A0AA40BDY7_9PEZI|nr:hypothetical protein B0T21DRAFT_443486 [Apiosordaria backusii]